MHNSKCYEQGDSREIYGYAAIHVDWLIWYNNFFSLFKTVHKKQDKKQYLNSKTVNTWSNPFSLTFDQHASNVYSEFSGCQDNVKTNTRLQI